MEQVRNGGQMRIIDPAMPTKAPSAPNRLRIMLMGLVLALGLSVGGVMFLEYRDQSFHGVEDLRQFTKVPILVRIPLIQTKGERRKAMARVSLQATASVVSLVLIIGAFHYMASENEQLVWMLSENKQPQPQAR